MMSLSVSQVRATGRAGGFACLVVFLAVPLPIAAQAKEADEPVLYTEGFVQVVSPDGETVDRCKEAAGKVLAAWKFDLDLMKWSDPAKLKGPLTLSLISDQRMRRERVGVRAVSKGTKLFIVKMGLIGDPSVDGTYAHELGHIQASRVLGTNRAQVPHYFFEGHGQILHQLYAECEGVDRHGFQQEEGKTIMALTWDEAESILTDEQYSKVGTKEYRARQNNKMERMGLYFVEYLRVFKQIPDVVPMMARVFEAVGAGQTYEQAFQQTYGLPLEDVIAEIAKLFRKTHTHPEDRLTGTRFEVTGKPDTTPRPPPVEVEPQDE